MSEIIVRFHHDEHGIARSWDEIGKLVRCKDCKHNHNCEIQYAAQAGDLFYCGAAERRIDE